MNINDWCVLITACVGIEWTQLDEFLSYGQSSVATGGLVRNELILTNIATGRTVPVRSVTIISLNNNNNLINK